MPTAPSSRPTGWRILGFGKHPEIAAALQDHGRAVVAGQRTRGKASVQTPLYVGVQGMSLKLTTGTFVRKDGKGRTQYSMQLDPTASPPSFAWSMSKNVSWVGSYRLEKDKMTMIFNSGNSVAQRPTDFEAKVQWRYVLRRQSR